MDNPQRNKKEKKLGRPTTFTAVKQRKLKRLAKIRVGSVLLKVADLPCQSSAGI
jgi:hypothetical protein